MKEKLLAALRGGITTVFIPEENEKDIADLPDSVKDGLKIIPVTHVSEVLAQALVDQPEPIEWDQAAEDAAAAERAKQAQSSAKSHINKRPPIFGGLFYPTPHSNRAFHPHIWNRIRGFCDEYN